MKLSKTLCVLAGLSIVPTACLVGDSCISSGKLQNGSVSYKTKAPMNQTAKTQFCQYSIFDGPDWNTDTDWVKARWFDTEEKFKKLILPKNKKLDLVEALEPNGLTQLNLKNYRTDSYGLIRGDKAWDTYNSEDYKRIDNWVDIIAKYGYVENDKGENGHFSIHPKLKSQLIWKNDTGYRKINSPIVWIDNEKNKNKKIYNDPQDLNFILGYFRDFDNKEGDIYGLPWLYFKEYHCDYDTWRGFYLLSNDIKYDQSAMGLSYNLDNLIEIRGIDRFNNSLIIGVNQDLKKIYCLQQLDGYKNEINELLEKNNLPQGNNYLIFFDEILPYLDLKAEFEVNNRTYTIKLPIKNFDDTCEFKLNLEDGKSDFKLTKVYTEDKIDDGIYIGGTSTNLIVNNIDKLPVNADLSQHYNSDSDYGLGINTSNLFLGDVSDRQICTLLGKNSRDMKTIKRDYLNETLYLNTNNNKFAVDDFKKNNFNFNTLNFDRNENLKKQIIAQNLDIDPYIINHLKFEVNGNHAKVISTTDDSLKPLLGKSFSVNYINNYTSFVVSENYFWVANEVLILIILTTTLFYNNFYDWYFKKSLFRNK